MPRLKLLGTEVEVDASLIARMEGLPEAGFTKKELFTEEMDALLLTYWPVKRHLEVAKCLGVSKDSALKRYRELTDGVDA